MVLPNFKENLEKYAKLLVANGINVQPSHTMALKVETQAVTSAEDFVEGLLGVVDGIAGYE